MPEQLKTLIQNVMTIMRVDEEINNPNVKIVTWFSCGNNSFLTAKFMLELHAKANHKIVRCVVPEEHPDNDRVHRDCEKFLNFPITSLKSKQFNNCFEVWEKRKYLSGPRGAPCTIEMKKKVRWDFERDWQPDFQAFGFSLDEAKRAARFRTQNPEVKLLTPLIDLEITKKDCANLVKEYGLELPMMYRLGFSNNNCIGCVKASSMFYWARVRHLFPERFKKLDELSKRVGCRLAYQKRKRIFLHEIPEDIDWRKKDNENVECSLMCVGE